VLLKIKSRYGLNTVVAFYFNTDRYK